MRGPGVGRPGPLTSGRDDDGGLSGEGPSRLLVVGSDHQRVRGIVGQGIVDDGESETLDVADGEGADAKGGSVAQAVSR